MIRNDRQLGVAQDQIREFESALDEATPAERISIESFIAELHEEIHEHQAIIDGRLNRFRVTSVHDLMDALVKARLSRRLTQRNLAERLGVTEQMVQRDEAGAYERAALYRIGDVIDALDFELDGSLVPSRGELQSSIISRAPRTRTANTSESVLELTQR